MINAQALGQRRTALGLSQRKLALLVGLNYQVIRRLEAGGDDGNLTLRDLAKICSSLDVAPAALLTAPQPSIDTTGEPVDELNLAQARILRQVHQCEEVRTTASREERELVVPALLRLGLVQVETGGSIRLTRSARECLEPHAFEG